MFDMTVLVLAIIIQLCSPSIHFVKLYILGQSNETLNLFRIAPPINSSVSSHLRYKYISYTNLIVICPGFLNT